MLPRNSPTFDAQANRALWCLGHTSSYCPSAMTTSYIPPASVFPKSHVAAAKMRPVAEQASGAGAYSGKLGPTRGDLPAETSQAVSAAAEGILADTPDNEDALQTLLLQSQVKPLIDSHCTQRIANHRSAPLTWLTKVRSPLYSARFLQRHHTTKPLKFPRMATEGAVVPPSRRVSDRRPPSQQGGG